MSKSQKMSSQRLDVVDSLCAFLKTDPKTPEIAPREITCQQVIAWQAACTNPSGFRQTSEKFATHINKTLPLDAKGPRGTVLRFPQWIREYSKSKGVYDLNKILREYNEAIVKTPAK